MMQVPETYEHLTHFDYFKATYNIALKARMLWMDELHA